MANLSKILFIVLFLSSCGLTSYYVDPVYEDHPHTTEIYWYTDYELGGTPYFGYWNDFYYYYGVAHFYPWWYYYQFIPPYHYYIHSHIHIHCDNGHYVYGHRGPTLNNNVAKDFRPTIKIKNNKDKSFVFPQDWKSSNSTRINKQDNWWNKVNMNKTDYNRTFNYGNSSKNDNKHNNNININKNNNKIKVNNGSKRSNKTNTSRRPKK